jgi:glycosyltransferase involved in cell wall biosynthesis
VKKAIIIPIYLRFRQPEELPSLEGLRLTKRAIKSLDILEDQDFTLILPVCFNLIEGGDDSSILEMDRFLRKELRNLREGKTFLFSTHHLKMLRRYLDQRGFKKLFPLIDLNGFPKIRNTGLLLAHALSMDVVIFIDNDEVLEEPQYLGVACDYLNQTWDGKLVSGKGGFYINADGEILLPPQRLWWRILWNKTKWMNRVWKKILSSKDRLVSSPMFLGGNLVLHRHVFQKVPFDPHIPRGEDTDYFINATRLGFCLLFDKELRIRHLHPERTDDYFHHELRGDIERFLYEREKVKKGPGPNLDPYPGYFMKWTLYPKAAVTSFLLSLDYLRKQEWKRAAECMGHIRLLFQKEEGEWSRYSKFYEDWGRMMDKIEEERLGKLLDSCWV